MAHIVEDERTHEDLNLWRDGCTLNVLSFFLNGILACATWKELVPDRSMAIMTRLIYILGALVGALQPWCIPPFGPPFHEKLPEPLFALMEMTELYVAPEFGLKRIFIQISAEAWARFCYSAFPTADTTGEGSMASHVSAVQVRRAVRILCVPSFKGRAAGSRDRSEGAPWDIYSLGASYRATNWASHYYGRSSQSSKVWMAVNNSLLLPVS